MKMFACQQSVVSRPSSVVFLCFALLTTETSSLKTEPTHPGQSDEPYAVRLVEGGSRCEGRLEGKYHGEWRPLFHRWWSKYWSLDQAAHVCRKLDCGGVMSTSSTFFSTPQDIWEFSYRCEEHQSSEQICNSWSESTSSSSFTVTCAENVRLVDQLGRCSGQLEVKSNQSWVSVCEADFDWQDAAVVCRNLGCGFLSRFWAMNAAPTWSKEFKCDGREKHLLDCPTSDSAINNCSSGPTNLICRERPYRPNFTLYSSKGEVSHGVRSHGVRSQVGKGHRFAIYCSVSSLGPVLSFRLKRVFSEDPTEQTQPAVDSGAYFLFPAADDTHRGHYECAYNYDHTPDIFSDPVSFFLNVKELSDVRLVDGGSRCAGRLEVEHQGEFRPVSYWDSWSLKAAAVVCKQLNCGSAVSTAKVDSSANPMPMWRFLSACDGSESALMDCGTVKMWPSSSTVEVVCSGLLLQPNLTLYSFVAGLSEGQQQGLQLFSGHSFTISCSIQPQYPGGQFTLIFNQTLIQTQQAVNHSAHFLFPAADDAHQGNYSCVYHNYVFNHNFSSESQTLSLNVTEPEDVLLVDGGSRCAGRLEVEYQEEWRPLGSQSTVWGLKHAAVVCRQLDCGSAVSTKVIDVSTTRLVWRFFSDCDGSESALMDCGTVKLWPSSSGIEVVCTGHQEAEAQQREQ